MKRFRGCASTTVRALSLGPGIGCGGHRHDRHRHLVDGHRPRQGDAHEHLQNASRVETKVDMLIDRGKDHEERIRVVEKRSWWMGGAAALLAFIAPEFITRFTS